MDDQTPTTPADSSPAPISGDTALASFTPDQETEWLKSGKLPDTIKKTFSADSSPAEPDTQAASTDATSELPSEAAKPGPKPKKNADTRIEQLLADRKQDRERADRLERELQALRTTPRPDVRPAESSPATAEKPRVEDVIRRPDPTRPMLTEQEFFTQFPEAPYSAHAIYGANYFRAVDGMAHQQQAQQSAFLAHEHETLKQYQERMAVDFPKGEGLADAVSEEIRSFETIAGAIARAQREGRPVNLTVENCIADEILRSEMPGKVQKFLTQQPDALAFLRASTGKDDLKRRIGQIEGQVKATLSAAPSAIPVTGAPAPGTTLGTRPSAPNDPVAGALKRHDFEAYERAMNARELAARKR